jgi:hypothetical protein
MNIAPFNTAAGPLKKVLLGTAAVLVFFALSAPGVHAEDAYIVDVVRTGPQDRVMVSAILKGAMTKDIKDSIESGAPVIFTYLVKLERVRRVVWNETVREVAVKKLVKYDALRKVYLTWEKKGDSPEKISFDAELSAAEHKDIDKESASAPSSPAKDPAQPPQETTVLKEREALEKWMTHLDNVDLGSVSEMRSMGRHYASVKCEMKAIQLMPPFNYILFFVSLWDFDTKWSDSTIFVVSAPSEPPR